MNDIIETLASQAPELFFGFLFIAALWVIFREYSRMGSQIKDTVQTEVAAQLGRTMGDLRISSEEAARVKEEIGTKLREIRRASEEFDSRVTAQEVDLNEKFQHLRERVARFEQSLPEEREDAKVPASMVAHALRQATNWRDAAGLVDTLASDPDTTAKDLELAGDRCRLFGQFTRALELYHLSREKDPERKTVAIEYLTLKAEQSYAERPDALREAMEVAIDDPNEVILARLADALVELNRFGLLKELCQQILSKEEVLKNPGLVGLCRRNLGTAYRRLNQPEEAAREFRKAYEMDPENENLLSGLAHHLLEEREYQAALPLFAELLHLDPFDPNYYFSMGVILERLGRPEDAIDAFEMSREMADDGPLKDQALRAGRRLSALKDLPGFVTENRTLMKNMA